MYYIVLRYSQIKFISVNSQSAEPSIYFSLFQAPSFEQKPLPAVDVEVLDVPYQRLSCLPFEHHDRVAPYTSLAMRVICSSATDIETFRHLCADAHIWG